MARIGKRSGMGFKAPLRRLVQGGRVQARSLACLQKPQAAGGQMFQPVTGWSFFFTFLPWEFPPSHLFQLFFGQVTWQGPWLFFPEFSRFFGIGSNAWATAKLFGALALPLARVGAFFFCFFFSLRRHGNLGLLCVPSKKTKTRGLPAKQGAAHLETFELFYLSWIGTRTHSPNKSQTGTLTPTNIAPDRGVSTRGI